MFVFSLKNRHGIKKEMPKVKVTAKKKNMVCFMRKRKAARGKGSVRGGSWFGKILTTVGKHVTKETLKRAAKEAAKHGAKLAVEKGAQAMFNRFGSRRRKRGGQKRGGGLAGGLGGILIGVGQPVAENFYNTARRKADEHKERIKRLYYYR